METVRKSFFEKLVDNLSFAEKKIYSTLNGISKKRFQISTEINFHNEQLEIIKNKIGNSLRYISHCRYKNDYSIKAILLTSEGKKELNFKLHVVPSKMNKNDYSFISKEIKKAL